MTIIKRNWKFIEFIARGGSSIGVKCLLDNLTTNQSKLLSEICLNVLAGNVKISEYYSVKLKPHKNILISWAEGKGKKSFVLHHKLLIALIKASYRTLKCSL